MRYRWIDRIETTGGPLESDWKVTCRGSHVAAFGYAAAGVMIATLVPLPVALAAISSGLVTSEPSVGTAKLAGAALIGVSATAWCFLQSSRHGRRRVDIALDAEAIETTHHDWFGSHTRRLPTRTFVGLRRLTLTSVDGRYEGLELVHTDPHQSVLIVKANRLPLEISADAGRRLGLPEITTAAGAPRPRDLRQRSYGQADAAMA